MKKTAYIKGNKAILMNDLFAALFFISLLFLVVGLIKPSSMSWLLKAKSNRGMIGAVFGTAVFVLFVITGITAPAEEEKKVDAPKQAITPPPSPSSVPVELSEARKKQIYYEITAAEDRAHKEADGKYPTEAAAISGFSTQQIEQRLYANQNLSDELASRYRAELRTKFGITESQQKQVVNEGSIQKWPMPAV